MYNQTQPVIQKPRFALSTLALGFIAIVITCVLAGATVTVYGVHVIDQKSDSLLESATLAIKGAPEFLKSLPAPIKDILNDRRAPEYAKQLQIEIELSASGNRKDVVTPIVRIANRGSEMVSLLSLRVVLLNADGIPVAERSEWAATPLAAEDNWRGPILAGATRVFPAGMVFLRQGGADDCKAVVEVTDVRVWDGSAGETQAVANAG